jgi:hypothetical protein
MISMRYQHSDYTINYNNQTRTLADFACRSIRRSQRPHDAPIIQAAVRRAREEVRPDEGRSLKAVKIGRRTFVRPDDLRAFIASAPDYVPQSAA